MSKIMYKDKQILGCISDAQYVAFNNTDTGLSATNVQSAITEVNGKLVNIEVIKITVTTGYDNSAGVANVDISIYPNIITIIPFGYDVTLGYRVGCFDITSKSIRFAVQDAVSGAWANSKTINFKALLITS